MKKVKQIAIYNQSTLRGGERAWEFEETGEECGDYTIYDCTLEELECLRRLADQNAADGGYAWRAHDTLMNAIRVK